MKLILHIGTEKTGTSSLQLWGSQNREKLKEDKIFYSSSLGNIDHRKASVYPLSFGMNDDGFERYGINSELEFNDFKSTVLTGLTEEIETAKKEGGRYFVISSEHLHSRIVTSEMVKNLKELFTPFFSDKNIFVLAYLRPQAELFQSRISVGVRNMTHSPGELEHLWQKETNYFNYNEMWVRWSSHFKNVIFKPFNQHKDVVFDLCNFIEINIENYNRPKRVNEKLDYRMGLISYHLRNKINSINLKKQIIDLYLEDIKCKEPIKISKTLASKINNFYRESNLTLCQSNNNFTMLDLESDLRNFPVEGTAEKMFSNNHEIEFLAEILIRNYLNLHLLRCQNIFVSMERAFARGNSDNAHNLKKNLATMLGLFDGVDFSLLNINDIKVNVTNLKSRLEKEG